MQRVMKPWLCVILLAGSLSVSACIPPVPLGRHTVVVKPTLAPGSVSITPSKAVLLRGETVQFTGQVQGPNGTTQTPMRWSLEDSYDYEIGADDGVFRSGRPAPDRPRRGYQQSNVWFIARIKGEPRDAREAVGSAIAYGLSKEPSPITMTTVKEALDVHLEGDYGDEGPNDLTPAQFIDQLESEGWYVSRGVRRELEASFVSQPPAATQALKIFSNTKTKH